MTFDLDREFEKANSRIQSKIEQSAYWAVRNLYSMHAVGSGICYCGSDIDSHGWGDNHGPVEMMMDKSYDNTIQG